MLMALNHNIMDKTAQVDPFSFKKESGSLKKLPTSGSKRQSHRKYTSTGAVAEHQPDVYDKTNISPYLAS